jgi:hypothetical protein
MKALTVKQPWAELIVLGMKDVENRTRRTHYRGPLAIHVSLTPSKLDGHFREIASLLDGALRHHAAGAREENWDAGLVIGTVDLLDCVRDSDSKRMFPDHWHWVFANPQRLDVPVPAKGRLGLWEWTP